MRFEHLRCGFASCLVLAGCRGLPEGAIEQCSSQISLPASVTTDILFVIDNSGSMREEQQKVIDELSTFVQSLASGPVDNDFQIGVITNQASICRGSALGITVDDHRIRDCRQR